MSFIQNGFAVTALRPVPAPTRPEPLVPNNVQHVIASSPACTLRIRTLTSRRVPG